MEIAGEAKYVDSRGKTYSIEGVGSLPDDINLQRLEVSGSIEFDEISCGKITIDGSSEGKSLTAEKVSVSGSLEVDALKVEDSLKICGSIEAETVEAGEIEIESRGSSIDSVKCIKLKIFHDDDRIKSRSRVIIKNIAAVKVDIENCEADEITCTDAKIGENCAIGKLIVAGDYEVADGSKVGEIIKEDAK